MTILAKRYTTAELKAIDEKSLCGDTGASQAPGWYWQENEDGELVTGPVGPFRSKAEALREANKLAA